VTGPEQLGFTDENRRRLDEFLGRTHLPGAVAALDLDGTCLHNDVGEAVLHTMARESLLDVSTLLDADLLFRPFREHPQVPDPGQAIRQGNGDAIIQAYRRLIRCAGKQVAYQWAVFLAAGLTEEELTSLSHRVIRQEMAMPLGRSELEDGICEERPFVIEEGLRPYHAMTKLVHDLQGAGIQVWIVTATNRWSGAAYAEQVLSLPADRVIGMSARVENGRILPEPEPGLPATFGDGKVEAIHARIERDPVFAAGDTLSQCEMLCISTGLSLVIDKGDEALRERIASYRAVGDDRWLVQPRFIDPP
jgi:phosphoserine phosphatase